MDYRKMAEDALAERARVFEARKALNDSNATEAEKREGFERMDADMDRLASEARAHVEAGERDAEVRSLHARAGNLNPAALEGRARNESAADDFAAGWRAVASGEARAYDFGFSDTDFRNAVRALPTNVIESVSNGAGDNQSGVAGKVTPATFVADMLASMIDASDIVSRVRKISTSGGEVMNWPRRIARVGNTFQHVLEAAKYPSVTDGDFSLFPLSAHKFGAIAELPFEALSDPALNIAGIVAEEMGQDLAESLCNQILNNPSNTFSQGLLSSIVINTSLGAIPVAPANYDSALYDKLIDVQHSLRQVYRKNATWTVSDDFEKLARKVKDGENRYIWSPGVIADQPDMLLGKPVAVEYLMPAAASGAVGVLYGDLGRFYVLRTVRDMKVTRSDEYGFDRDTVALKIGVRVDGGVTDPQALAQAKFA